jgi:hypothetical protein
LTFFYFLIIFREVAVFFVKRSFMKINLFCKSLAIFGWVFPFLTLGNNVQANPISATYVDLPQCRNYDTRTFTEELGGTHSPNISGPVQTGGATANPFQLLNCNLV